MKIICVYNSRGHRYFQGQNKKVYNEWENSNSSPNWISLIPVNCACARGWQIALALARPLVLALPPIALALALACALALTRAPCAHLRLCTLALALALAPCARCHLCMQITPWIEGITMLSFKTILNCNSQTEIVNWETVLINFASVGVNWFSNHSGGSNGWK